MAKKYPHKLYGWRIEFKVPQADGTIKLKTKYSKHDPDIVLEKASRLELLIRGKTLTQKEAAIYVVENYLTNDEAAILTETPPLAMLVATLSKKQREALIEILKRLP